MKKWLKILLSTLKWTMVIAYFVVILSFVSSKNHQIVCSKINVNITDSLNNSFITYRDVLRIVEKKNDSPIGKPLWMINTHELEQRFRTQNTVKDVAIFKTANGNLNINVTQRVPMVRVINKYNQGYYIDSEGQLLPLSQNYTSHVMVINGNIVEPFKISPNVKIMDWADSLDYDSYPLICKLYELAKFIHSDPFWNAQIAQVYVESPNDIELIPRVGLHVVQFGDLTNIETKFKKLRLFYEQALPAEGWNKYKEINLKYKNQIVCTKI
ncbi:MAG TPA: hypothetical protein PL017_02705 [Tenuifilaceae bacterium]|nr:hypothetical protein [Tenuifilaceae bacterium]HPJ44981.1 hypothetical protein [Tenuifilaceae bacterium]HPQ33772.1 hypothetical protein [Tenuifilaceae bacterium]HRX67664.1 hypothetical protein [Tenuifilaceae bacterium]